MKEHPIIFNGEMVRAILAGTKTQTRRVIRVQPLPWAERFEPAPFRSGNVTYGKPGDWIQMTADTNSQRGLCRCRYGVAGDLLWVRETVAMEAFMEGESPRVATDGRPLFHDPGGDNEFDEPYWLYPHYKATDPTPDLCYEDQDEDGPACHWTPSIHMPRWASRITLEIVRIQVQRLQEINEEDAMAEGAPLGRVVGYGRLGMESHREGFIELWDSINAKRGYGWLSNPWVWVINFNRINP